MLARGQGFQRRVENRGGLADSGGRFHQQLAGPVDALVHQLGYLPLPAAETPVGKRQRQQALVPPASALQQLVLPAGKGGQRVAEELLQFPARVHL